MPQLDLTTLLGFPGFKVTDIMQQKRGWRSRVVLSLERERGFRFRCSGCGEAVAEVTPYRQRWVRHLFLWQHATVVRFQQYRVICPTCGLKVEALPWLAPYARVTTILAALVAELCKVMTNKAVGLLMELHTGAVKAIDKASMQKAQAERPLDGITALGVDEIAVGKGTTTGIWSRPWTGRVEPNCSTSARGARKRTSKASGSGSVRSAPGASPMRSWTCGRALSAASGLMCRGSS
jgi:hypothetical protein